MWINKEKTSRNKDYVFAITSILTFTMCCLIQAGGDDIGFMRVQERTISACWKQAVNMYETWSSRVLINFVIFIFTSICPTIMWGVYMGVSMYILQKAFSLLFLEKDVEGRKKYNLLISALILAFPFAEMVEAGWISVSCTYFGPIAFGFMSLVPIKKVNRKEKMKWWEYPAYVFCLIYGANNEQMMVVIVCSYLVALGYYLFKHQCTAFITIMGVLSAACLIFILTCPGNRERMTSELIHNNPTYSMLNFVNKLELGMSTAVRYLLFGNKLYVLIVCVCFSILIFEKYNDIMFRIISCVPIVVVGMLGFMKDIISKLYPSVEILTKAIPHDGLINAQNAGGGGYAICQYFVMGITVITICIEVFLLQDNIEGILKCFTFLFSGVASRVAIGFSPSIWVSGSRTCAVMNYCIIATAICTMTGYPKSLLVCDKAKNIYIILIVAAVINLWCLVMTKFW